MLISAVVFPRKVTIGVVAFFVGAGLVLGFIEPWLAGRRQPPGVTLQTLLFVIVVVGNLGLLALIVTTILNRLSAERSRSERLLLNVLPASVAAELKECPEARRVNADGRGRQSANELDINRFGEASRRVRFRL